jgi:uroporphyrinogen decarboxylase
MTKRDRFLAFANFEPVDRVPRKIDCVAALKDTLTEYLGAPPRRHFDMDHGRSAGLRPPDDYAAPDYSAYHADMLSNKDFAIDEKGCGHLGHGFYHFTEYISPLRRAQRFDDIESYPYPDKTTWLNDKMLSCAEEAHAAGDYAHIFVGHIYENAWQVRGYEPFLMDLITQREWAEFILDQFCENSLAAAVAAAKAGYDCIRTGDDVANQKAMMFQPDLWRAVMKPHWAKVIAAARDIKPDIHVWYHSDGNIWEILDDLVEIGVTILNPVQPECMDPVAVRKRMGKRLAFDGCIGTQTTFPFGTPDTMRQTVLELAQVLDARNGGLMISPTHVLEPEVPPQNVTAFFEACDELDWRSSEPDFGGDT